MGLRIETNNETTKICLRITGEVDLYTSPELRKAIMKAVTQSSGGVILDLTEVAYMDSSGVATLVEGLKANSDKKLAFSLRHPSQSVMKVLQLSRLDSVFQIEN